MKRTPTTFARISRFFLFLGVLVYVASATSVSMAQAQTVTLAFNASTSSNAELSGFGNVLRVTTSNSAAVSAAKTVTVNVTGGTATTADYNRTGTITIPAGTAHNSLVSIASGITITDDSLREADETISLSLTSPSSGAALGAQTTTTHTITDDETSYLTQAFGTAGILESVGVRTDYMTLVITGTAGVHLPWALQVLSPITSFRWALSHRVRTISTFPSRHPSR